MAMRLGRSNLMENVVPLATIAPPGVIVKSISKRHRFNLLGQDRVERDQPRDRIGQLGRMTQRRQMTSGHHDRVDAQALARDALLELEWEKRSSRPAMAWMGIAGQVSNAHTSSKLSSS